MSTLQKISDLEQKLSVFETLATTMPKVVQDMTRINSDLAQVSQAIKLVSENNIKRTNDLAQMDNMVITRLMGLEQSYASLSKTLAAIISELSDSKVLNQNAVMVRLRKSDEAADKARIEQLIELKMISPSEEVSQDSLIVVSQEFNLKSGETDLVAEYRSFELSSPMVEEEVKKSYIGKKIGEVVELSLEEGTLKTKILETYNYVQSASVETDKTQ
jgi:hypothetical protein